MSAKIAGDTPGRICYQRTLHMKAREVNLSVPKLRRQTFKTAIVERYRRREASVEEALIEISLAGGPDVSRHHRGAAGNKS